MRPTSIYRIILGGIIFLSLVNNLYAGAEEDACFSILKEKTLNIYGVDITDIYNGYTNIDVSTYTKFKSKKYRPTGNPGGFFNSQRNNIGTIILPFNYITTQYVPLGSATDFKFPINNGGSLIGDEFTVFRNQMVYTHHNIFDGGSFLSCGYLRITPYGTYTYYDLDPSNYFTNIIDGGGFEIEDSREINLGVMGTGHYIIGKSVVQGAAKLGFGSSTSLDNLFKVDIVNVIYDNGSSYFNEYETYPLQVDAMTNADTFTTAWSLQQDFMSRVVNQTCLSFAHPSIASLPPICSGAYKSLSFQTRGDRFFATLQRLPQESLFGRVFSFIIPQASAALEKEELKEVQSRVDTASGGIGNTVMIDSNFDYFQFKKIKSLPSERLQEYILMATNLQYDLDLKSQVASGIILDEYSKVFYECGISYEDRVKNIKKWIDSIDISTFSIENIEYPDPKIGDCILPFPDRRNKDKIIPGSFKTNQQYAQYLINLKNAPTYLYIEDLKKKMQELEQQYAQEIAKANSLITSGDVINGNKLLSEASIKYEPQIEKIQKEMYDFLNPGSKNKKSSQDSMNNNYISYILIVIGLIICFVVVYSIRNGKNKKNPVS